MGKLTLKTRIYNYLKAKKDWTHKGILSDKAKEAGYSAENVGRRLRELHEEKLIDRKLNEKGHVLYKIAGAEKPRGDYVLIDGVYKYVTYSNV